MSSSRRETGALVIGTGLAGCAAAMQLSDAGAEVLLVTRAEEPSDTASSLAQGGIVYRAEGEDETSLVEDILSTGGGICNRPAVELLAKEGPALVEEILMDRLRIRFDQNDAGGISLAGEAAHSVRRILHIGDQTGRDIEAAFLRELSSRKNVTIWASHTAVDLLTLSHHSTDPQDFYRPPRCVGAYLFDRRACEVKTVLSRETILATGGLGQLYLHTTNPPGARGDGLAMAYRTGTRIMNLEYVQFHPTALYRETRERPLISEALRGEGARLLNHAGEEFLKRHDPRGALAPRDIVARGIHDEMLREGVQWVYLDISRKPADWIRQRFPWAYRECMARGIDITRQPIPVVPAAHYSCGGVAVDLDGNTSLAGLKAVGEVSCTGVHGANRLASTSLLEGLVWGAAAGRDLASRVGRRTTLSRRLMDSIPDWVHLADEENEDPALIAQDWATIRSTMWNYVGISRTESRLHRAFEDMRALNKRLHDFYKRTRVTKELVQLFHGCQAAYIVTLAAHRNPVTMGCHYRVD